MIQKAKQIFLLHALLLVGSFGFAQKKVEILHADELSYKANIIDATRLLGNVKLKFEGALMNCDSAYLYEDDNFDAYGHIQINQGDTIRLFGDELQFEAETKQARLRKNIRLIDKDMTLTTDILDYDLESEIASYFSGGRLVSKNNNNVLISEQGFYDSRSEFFHFRDDVILSNPEYRVESDTLQYSSLGEKAYFFGPTKITSGKTTIYCENGWYETLSEICQFNQNALIYSGNNELKGDSIYYDGKAGIGEVFGKVGIRDTTSNYQIGGEYGWHNEITEESFVTGRALMTQYFDDDSLYLHADTLKAIPDSNDFKKILAYKGVRFFKRDLQGIADSLAYVEADSTIYLYQDPVLWSSENQMFADSVKLKSFEGIIENLYMDGNAFITSEVMPKRYNQIKGRKMTGYFKDNDLRKVVVEGNGQAIYIPVEEKGGKVKEMGLNRVECSDIVIYVNGNDIESISFLIKPSGSMNPISKISESDRTLEGFIWRATDRPLSLEDLFE